MFLIVTFGLAIIMALQIPMLKCENNKSHISYPDLLYCHKIAKSNILLLSDDFLTKEKNMTWVNQHNELMRPTVMYIVHCIVYKSSFAVVQWQCDRGIVQYGPIVPCLIVCPRKSKDCGLLKCSI